MYIISGMHRSGTSLVAQVFFEAGFNLGNPETFYAADEWNVDGYYEQPEIHAVNMPLINGPWGKLSYFKLPTEKTILQRGTKFTHAMTKANDRYKGKVVKETRFSLTLPAWLKHGDLDVEGMVVCLRHPYEVARSIKKRNHVPLAVGYALWLDHNRRLLKYTDPFPTYWLRYDRLFSTESFREEMAAAFTVCGKVIPAEKRTDLFTACVKPGLKHHVGDDNALPSEVAALWSELQTLYSNQV